jgi:hypothetical protein
MKLCYNLLDDITLSKSGNYWVHINNGAKLYYYDECLCCGEPYLGQRKSKGYCSKKCSSSGSNNGMFGKYNKLNHFYGKRHTEESKMMISFNRRGKYTGTDNHNYGVDFTKENNPRWKGGNYCYKCGCLIPVRRRMCEDCNKQWKIEVEQNKINNDKLYHDDWTDNLKKHIRYRDKNKCQNPLCSQKHYRLDVHHIDYDKMNCNPNNLITLCVSCHASTNTIELREWYTEYYKTIVENKYVS